MSPSGYLIVTIVSFADERARLGTAMSYIPVEQITFLVVFYGAAFLCIGGLELLKKRKAW